jgi:hypothetical protein
VFFVFDAFSSREPVATSLENAPGDRAEKSQLMLAAAMRRNRFFSVT